MNIIISGAGKVGFNLAKVLSIGHNVTILDTNAEALATIQESLDILTIHGESENCETYKKIKDKNVNLFIAVTNDDNVNLISIMIADIILNIDRKIIRFRKQFFNNNDIKKRLNIEKMIFPLEIASKSIASLLLYPKIHNVKSFKYTNYTLISLKVSSLFTPQILNSNSFAIVGIERAKDFFITPHNGIEILPNDLVYIFCSEEDIGIICQDLVLESNTDISKCAIYGAGDLGIAIANQLAQNGCNVKLVEKDFALCEMADEKLGGRVSIINTKYSSHDIFKNEGLDSADIFIASTNDDEFNIIKSLEAKESGISKVIAINNEIEYYNLMHVLGIIAVRGPKISAYNSIMEEINSTNIIIQKYFCGLSAIVFLRKIFANSKLIGKSIKPLNLESSAFYYIRKDGGLSLFDSTITLQEGDLIVLFTIAKESQKVKEWFYGL